MASPRRPAKRSAAAVNASGGGLGKAGWLLLATVVAALMLHVFDKRVVINIESGVMGGEQETAAHPTYSPTGVSAESTDPDLSDGAGALAGRGDSEEV